MGFTYAFSQAAVANIREVNTSWRDGCMKNGSCDAILQTDDALNSAAGGCAAGFLAGARGMSIFIALF